MIGINGHRGFIGKALIKLLKEKNISYIELPRVLTENDLKGITKILFLSSPSDNNDFKNRYNTSISMMDDYIKNVNMLRNTNIFCIFGSSLAVEDTNKYSNDYTIFKIAIERYIASQLEFWGILRIPRVYGKNREKGLMQTLKYNYIDDGSTIEFIDIEDFTPNLLFAIENINNHNIINFETNKKMNLREIKNYYNL